LKIQDLDVKVVEFFEPDIDNQLTAISFLADDFVRRKISYLPLALKGLGRENV